jgi:hypothetical protein
LLPSETQAVFLSRSGGNVPKLDYVLW